MANDTKFGKQLRAIRNNVEWSQGDLANATGLSVEAISNLERGLNYPSYQTLEKLSEALKVPVRDFFEFDEQESARSELLVALLTNARQLSDSDLAAAVKIMQVLVQR